MLKLNKDKKYILACSYGPDSMALFYMLLNEKFDFVVCNIDYNYRPESGWETDSIKKVCEENNIQFFTKSVLFSTRFHNFEAWARDIRYEFFKEIGNKLNIHDILIAHQEDDLIETYLMQKERGGIVSFYGLNESYTKDGFTYHRPLLNYTKKELIEYCNKYNYEFTIDPTNFDQTYRRNFFRHSVLPTLSETKREEILDEISNLNIFIIRQRNKIEQIIENDRIPLYELINNGTDFVQRSIIMLLEKNHIVADVSKGLIDDLLKSLKKAHNWEWAINENFILKTDYNFLSLINLTLNYELPLDNNIIDINYDSSDYESLKKCQKLSIKPAKLASFYKIKNYKKKINRVFIDWKMPHFIRNIWPAIFDENNNIVYMPRYRECYKITDDSLLIFDLESLYKFIKSQN